MKLKREIKIGVVVVAALFLFVWGMNFLKGRNLFSRQMYLYAEYDQIDDLMATNPVTLNGVAIGQVQRIFFHPDGSGRVVVRMLIDNQIALPTNSVAVLAAADLMGTREIQIRLGDLPQKVAPGDTLTSEMTYSLAQEVSEQLRPLRIQAEQLFGQIDSIVGVVNNIFNAQTQYNIISSIESLNKTLVTLENTSTVAQSALTGQFQKLSVILANAQSITANLKDHNQTISSILQNLSQTSDNLYAVDLAETMNKINVSMQEFHEIVHAINSGEGTISLLLHDDALYRNLESSAKQLDSLLLDIRQNPRRYINISVF